MTRRTMVMGIAAAAGVCITGSSLAAPPAWTVIDGSTVDILANTPASPAYHCSYRIALSFANGANLVQDGLADLAAGAVKYLAATWSYDSPIRAAVLDDWMCVER